MSDRFERAGLAVRDALQAAQAAAAPDEFVDAITPLTHKEPCGLGDYDTVCGCPQGWPKQVAR